LAVNGRETTGVIQAMDFLTHNNRLISGEGESDQRFSARDQRVIVIGGGDTGSDCVGTALRQGAKSVHNFEIMPKPAGHRRADQPWPFWPIRLRTSTSHQEGGERHWALATQAIEVNGSGEVSGLRTAPVHWQQHNGQMQPSIDTENSQLWDCDLVLLAMGFTGADRSLAKAFDVLLTEQQLFAADAHTYQLSESGVFAAGDCRRGQSLIVWAIAEGRELARQIDLHLMGSSDLPAKGEGDLPGLDP
jgi:glutamate synthase (NADPH/NADH) small chain